MKKTVKGKVYDTAEMSVVKKVTSGAFGDPAGYEETLYVAENGSYFLYTYGGKNSKYPTEDIVPIERENVKNWMLSR